MKQHIFVATDGSDTAMKAVDLASEIATEFGVPLTVGHVLQFVASLCPTAAAEAGGNLRL